MALVERDARTAIDDPELDAAAGLRSEDADGTVRAAVRPGVGCDVRDRALEERGVHVHTRQRLRHVDLDATAVIAHAGERLRHDLVQPDHVVDETEAPRLDPAGIEQVADQGAEPIRLFLDRRQELGHLVGVPRDVVLAQAAHRGLDRRERRPQVVGDRREDRGSQIVDLDQLRGVLRIALQRPGADGDRELRDERGEHPAALGRQPGSADHEGRVLAEVQRLRSFVGRGRRADAGVGLDEPGAVAAKAAPARKAAKRVKASKVAATPIQSANGKARKAGGKNSQTFTIISNHKKGKERRLDPFTRAQKDKLLQLRDAMVDSMAGVAQDTLRARAEGSEATAFGMHQADAGSDAYDRDFALWLLSQEQDALYEIEEALKRIELGTYGICEMSGKPIAHARLEAIPFARYTVECQSQLEKHNKASRVRHSVTSLFGLTDDEGGEVRKKKRRRTKE